MKAKIENRISFNAWDASMLYEWFLALKQGIEIDCVCCPILAKRLEKFIGEKWVKEKQKSVKEHPYFPKKK